MIGRTDESTVIIDGLSIRALLDTGSDITTVSDTCYNSMDPRPELRSMSDFKLNIAGASGSSIPYTGYFEAEVCVPQIEHEPEYVPILVVPTTRFSGQVPVIVCTNIIGWLSEVAHWADLPSAWSTAFAAFSCTNRKFVKSTNKKPIVVYPNESKTITGMVRRTSHYENAVTENIDESNDLNICPCVVAVKANSKTARIPVRVCNISAWPITIQPRSQLCSLQEVNVLKLRTHLVTVYLWVLPQSLFEDLGIILPEENLSQNELQKAKDLLGSWKHIFFNWSYKSWIYRSH